MGNRNSNDNNSPQSNHSPEQNIDINFDNFTLRRRPQQIRILKCSSSIQKNSLALSPAEGNDFTLSFKYDAEIDCTAMFYLAGKDDPGHEISL